MNKLVLPALLILFQASAQRTDYWRNAVSGGPRTAWLLYENDLFARTDRYYSQGIALCYKQDAKPGGKPRSPFFQLPNSHKRWGIGLDHQVFTPTTISSDSLLENNRPYAATIRATMLFETEDTVLNRCLAWSLSVGIIGPEAGGKQMQTAIHKSTNNTIPKGWQHQLNTGLLLDASIHASQELVRLGKWLTFQSHETASLGTSVTDASFSLRLHTGFHIRSFSCFFYGYTGLRIVGYDGTLQDSPLASPSKSAIAANELKHLVGEQEVGFYLTLKGLRLAYWMHVQSPTFHDAAAHTWGGLRLECSF